MLVHYVDFSSPGIFMAEGEERKVQTRIPADLSKIPQYTFAIRYFDVEEVKKGKEVLEGKKKNWSICILFGETYNIETIETWNADGKYRTLINNIKCNSHDKKTGVLCITENWQALDKGDIVLSGYKDLKALKDPL